MRKLLGFVKDKTVLLVAIVFAAAVGGASTAIVMAAIPDSSGVIHGCYRTNGGLLTTKGSLRVIDTGNGESCSAQEMALNWSQSQSTPALANRITVADGQGSGQAILNVPNFGQLQVANCTANDNATNSSFRFHNGTTNTLSFFAASVGFVILAPGETSAEMNSNAGDIIWLDYGSGAGHHGVTLMPHAQPDVTGTCHFEAEAVSEN